MKYLLTKKIGFCVFAIIMFLQIQCTIQDDFSTREENEIAESTEDQSEEDVEETEAPNNDDEDNDNETASPEEDDDDDNGEETDLSEDDDDDETETALTDAEMVLALVNEARKENGLNELILNDALNQAAFLHSEDMLTNDYFSHEGLNGSRFWERTEAVGYTGSPRGENIAAGQRTPEIVHNAWMESDGHRANILNANITEMGLGRSSSGNYWTQIFGVGSN